MLSGNRIKKGKVTVSDSQHERCKPVDDLPTFPKGKVEPSPKFLLKNHSEYVLQSNPQTLTSQAHANSSNSTFRASVFK